VSAWASYHALLLAKQSELEEKLSNREEINAERLPDDLDNALALSRREVAVDMINRSQGVLRQVRTALKRFETGDYGLCLKCEEEISPNRLLVVPWAERCISCQEKEERRKQ